MILRTWTLLYLTKDRTPKKRYASPLFNNGKTTMRLVDEPHGFVAKAYIRIYKNDSAVDLYKEARNGPWT